MEDIFDKLQAITYQELKNRKMNLDTKGIIPVQV